MAEEHAEHKAHRSHGHAHHGGGGHEGEHEGAPEWLISFADNVMLQMGFFVILLALTLKTAKGGGSGGESAGEPSEGGPTPALLDAAIAIREAFNNPLDMSSNDANDLPLIRRLAERMGKGDSAQTGPKGREHDVRTIRPTEYFGMGGLVPFETGVAALSDRAREIIEDVVPHIRGQPRMIEIRGHVSAAEAYRQPDHGMRLSFDRATAVAAELVKHGIPWEHIRILACADNDRVASIAYEAAEHQANQRVEILVTSDPTVEEATRAP